MNTKVYPVETTEKIGSTLFSTDVNSIATFYLVAVRYDDEVKVSVFYIFLVRNIEKPAFDPSKFIVASGMHYITVNDASNITAKEQAMMNLFLGGAASALGNAAESVFDPIVYPLVDLMDARVAMDKKDRWNDNTFPTVKVKYVSEVVFKDQSNTTITVSTPDDVLTERMNFAGRASTVKSGEQIRVYYTIAKDPLEKWEIQAIERL